MPRLNNNKALFASIDSIDFYHNENNQTTLTHLKSSNHQLSKNMCVRPDSRSKEDAPADEATSTSMSKLVAVTGENQDLKSKVLHLQNQCESLEHELRFQTTKAIELQDLLGLKDNADFDGLTSKLLEKSLALAEKSLEIDELKMELQESKQDRLLMDQEREASVQMMAELTKVIREQQIELQRRDAESSQAERESEKLGKKHDKPMDCEDTTVVETPTTNDSAQLPNPDLLIELEKLRSERNALEEKNKAQKESIERLKQKNKEREATNISLMKDMKQEYEDDRERLYTLQKSLEAEISLLKEKKEEKEEVEEMLYGETVHLEPQDNDFFSFLFQDGELKVDVFDDSSTITEATMYTSSESDPSGSTGRINFRSERVEI
eukprot:scaffold4180_cov99-Cylindrotheca_fusiformis.AAC.11